MVEHVMLLEEAQVASVGYDEVENLWLSKCLQDTVCGGWTGGYALLNSAKQGVLEHRRQHHEEPVSWVEVGEEEFPGKETVKSSGDAEASMLVLLGKRVHGEVFPLARHYSYEKAFEKLVEVLNENSLGSLKQLQPELLIELQQLLDDRAVLNNPDLVESLQQMRRGEGRVLVPLPAESSRTEKEEEAAAEASLSHEQRLELINSAVASLQHVTVNETAAWNMWNYVAAGGAVKDAIIAFHEEDERRKEENKK